MEVPPSTAQLITDVADQDIYSSLQNFVVERKIGKGQFSEVWRGKNSVNNQIVALKKVQIFEMVDTKARQDCIKEIDLLKQLDHPNVIRYLASFIENNELNIVLEMADAGDLARFIRHCKKQSRYIPEKTTWKYFLQMVYGLQHMHHKRIMHRDIKPANCFLTTQGIVKLGDLGLGRFFGTNTNNAVSLVGTPYYMSPERIHEQPYNFKSDIWSAGCVLYELAALHSPFYGEKMNLFSLCKKIDKCEYPPLSGQHYSTELRNMVTACLNPEGALRPEVDQLVEGAAAMYAAFQQRQVGSSPMSPQPPTPTDAGQEEEPSDGQQTVQNTALNIFP